MTSAPPEDRPNLHRRRLSKEERDDLDLRIGARVREAGFDPVRPRNADDGPAPLPRNRWIFPSVAYSRAGKYASQFKAAFQGVETANFRLITLRFGAAKPATGELEAHIKSISDAAKNVVRYLVRQKLAQPQLSAIHIRFDETSGRLDPHLHGVWEIRPDLMSRVEELLRRHFSGVWIDEETVRRPSSVAFYICSGIVDHIAVPTWPITAIDEVWRLPARLHFVRPAGTLADWIKTHRASSPAQKPRKSREEASRDGKATLSASGSTDDASGHVASDSSPLATAQSKTAPLFPASTSSASSPAQEILHPDTHAEALGNADTSRHVSTDFNEILALLLELAGTRKTQW